MASVFRIAGYAFFWGVAHYGCFAVFDVALLLLHPSYSGPTGIGARMKEKLSSNRLVNIRRMFRTQLYCMFAAALGIHLLFSHYSHWPMDLLHQWGAWQEIGFEVAVGHWLVAMVEDTFSGKEIISHMTVTAQDARGMFAYYYSGLMAHHSLTVLAYSWCLYSHNLSGLCVFGLLFELPVVFVNARDIFATFSNWQLFDDTKQPIGDKTFYYIWVPIFITWHGTRTAACLLWPLSLLIWRSELNTVPIVSRLIYHFLGIMFNIVNVKLLSEVLPQCAIEDLRRTVSKMKAAGEKGENDSDSKFPPGSRHPRTEEPVTSQSLIGYGELSKHSTNSDLWIGIQGKVYDLSDFAHRHPGGAEVLMRVAGKDATAEFVEAGHSSKARQMMDQYIVAHLTPHGYDQNGAVPLVSYKTGDISKAYEFGKKYTGYDHPYIIFIFISALSVYLMALSFSEKPIFTENESRQSDFTLDIGVSGTVASLLLYASFACLVMLMWCVVFIANSLEHLIGFSHSTSTNPFLSLVIFTFSSVTIVNAVLLVIWLLCDVCLLSNTFVDGAGMEVAMSAYRISCMITVSAELLLKVRYNPRSDLHGFLPLAAAFIIFATGLDMFCFCQELHVGGGGDMIPQLLFVVFTAGAARAAYVRSIHYFSNIFSRRDADYVGLGTGCSHYLTTASSILLGAGLSIGLSVFLNHSYGDTITGAPNKKPVGDITRAVLDVVWARGDSQWIVAASLVGFGLLLLGSLIRESNAVFTSLTRSVAITLLLWYSGPSVGYAMYISFAATVASFYFLSKETSCTLQMKGTDAPLWLYTAKQHEYLWRRVLAMLIHYSIGMALNVILHHLSPEYESYLYTGPILDMGPEVEVGIAYQHSAKRQGAPQNFQCNVGYMKNMEEFIRTGMSTKAMLQEIIDDPEAGEKGFVADIVAHFYLNPKSFAGLNGYMVREVNLSAWTSEAAAYNWYKSSPAHKDIVAKHYGGGLENFTPLLASLKPSADRPIRYEVRCDSCRKVVKGPNADVCPFCEATMSHMPYF